MTISPKELTKTLEIIEKNLGKGSIHRGNETQDVYRIPYISPGMNYCTEGGIPIGRFSAKWGEKSAFKTRMVYEIIAQAQNLPEASERALMPRIKWHREKGNTDRVKRFETELEFIRETWPDGMECAFYNSEQQYDPQYAAKLGIDADRLIIIESQTIEDICATMQVGFPVIDMHVVDSTSSASSVEEQGMKMTDRRMGLDARVWKQSLKKAMASFDTDKNVGILVHQVSTNLRTGGSQAVSTKFLGHTSSMTLKMMRGKYLYKKDGMLVEDKPTGADDASFAGRAEADGVQIFAEVEKSRVCRPFRITRMHADFNKKSFDYMWEYANAAEWLGIVKKSGSWYTVKGDDNSVQGMAKLCARINGDTELQEKIYAELMHVTED